MELQSCLILADFFREECAAFEERGEQFLQRHRPRLVQQETVGDGEVGERQRDGVVVFSFVGLFVEFRVHDPDPPQHFLSEDPHLNVSWRNGVEVDIFAVRG